MGRDSLKNPFIWVLFSLVVFSSCMDERKVHYYSTVDKVNRVTVEYINQDTIIELEKAQIDNFKEILKRNVQPEHQRKFQADIQVNLYDGKDKVGALLIYNDPDKPFVNFTSEELGFGFQLTYGIGQYLNEKEPQPPTTAIPNACDCTPVGLRFVLHRPCMAKGRQFLPHYP
jgi:hypothetical protein